MKQKNYWENRNAKSNFLSSLKRKILYSSWINVFYPFVSIRFGDEKYIKDTLAEANTVTILDIACGAGKDILVYYSQNCIGIDIDGYPKEEVIKKGYKEALVYNQPDYNFQLNEPIDIISCINLNAHIPFEALEKILNTAFKYCRNGAHIIFVAEFYGGYSYEKHFKNEKNRNDLVNEMEHFYFESEDRFLKKLYQAFPKLELINRKSLTTIVSSIQYKYYFFKGKKPLRLICYISDFFLSIFNYLKLKTQKKSKTAFLVGYKFKIGE